MLRSLLKQSIAISSVFLAASSAYANDVITLSNGDSLTGKLSDSDQAGVYFLQYPDTDKALKIKEEFISNVAFSSSSVTPEHNSEKIMLVNGDSFPCELVAFDQDHVTVKSDFMGTQTIPRKLVQRVYFNNKSKNTLYEGPGKDLSGWTVVDSKLWQVNEGRMSTKSKTTIGRNIPKLPENFQLEFTAEWAGAAPRLKVYFCMESIDLGKRLDNYYLDISSLEFRLTHYVKKRYKTLGNEQNKPGFFTNPKGKVTLYVDRKNKTISLYYNGKKVKDFKDAELPPKGNGIVFHTLQRTGEEITLSNIKVSSWNGAIRGDEGSKEKRLAENDIITDVSGSPMTGKLIGIKKENGSFALQFKIAFANKAASIPVSKVQYIDLQQMNQAEDQKELDRSLSLAQGGQLSFASSQMIDQHLVLDHPVLGKVKIDRKAISHLERKEDK